LNKKKKKHVFIYEKTSGDLKLDYEKVDWR
jgi:hypothetical protein